MAGGFEEQIYNEVVRISRKFTVAPKTLNFSESVRRTSTGEYAHNIGCRITIFGKVKGVVSTTATLDESDSVLTDWVEYAKLYFKKKKFQIVHVDATTFRVSQNN